MHIRKIRSRHWSVCRLETGEQQRVALLDGYCGCRKMASSGLLCIRMVYALGNHDDGSSIFSNPMDSVI